MVVVYSTLGFYLALHQLRKSAASHITTSNGSDERKPEQHHCELCNPQFPPTPPASRSTHDMHSAANGFHFSQTLLFFTARAVKWLQGIPEAPLQSAKLNLRNDDLFSVSPLTFLPHHIDLIAPDRKWNANLKIRDNVRNSDWKSHNFLKITEFIAIYFNFRLRNKKGRRY